MIHFQQVLLKYLSALKDRKGESKILIFIHTTFEDKRSYLKAKKGK